MIEGKIFIPESTIHETALNTWENGLNNYSQILKLMNN
jgi:hypothetical protein